MNVGRNLLQISLVALSSFLSFFLIGSIEERPLVILITSYNNERWIDKNLDSVFMQKYENYRVIYIDDCSADRTYEWAVQLVHEKGQESRFTIIRNQERRNAMANFYTAIHSCDDDEVIITLDGDDFFVHDQVLATVNTAYSNPDIWFTYGEYMYYPANQRGDVNKTFPQWVIDSNRFRQYWWFPVSHLRTHYAWLFKLVKLEDFLRDGYFYAMTSDKAMLAPMIEMASRGHFLQIQEPLYMYNNSNPINDGMVNVNLQTALRDYILSKDPYHPLDNRESVESFDQKDHVTLILLCSDQPNTENIDSMLRQLKPLHAVIVLAPVNSVINNHNQAVSYILYEQDRLVQELRRTIASVDSRYLLLSTGADRITSDIDLSLCLKLLKKTHTLVFYLGLGYEAEKLNNKRLPRVSQEYPVFAWFSGNKNCEWQSPVLDMTLWSKELLNEGISLTEEGSLSDLQISLNTWLTRENKLGLIFSKSIATC